MDRELYAQVASQLTARRQELEKRMAKIQSDRRRQREPLDPDFEEQATQRENDEALDALDLQGRRELQAIEVALERIAAGAYGSCDRCGDAIETRRLESAPTATLCVACMSDTEAKAASASS